MTNQASGMGGEVQPAPAIGQIWREVDPRFSRFVRVEALATDRRSVSVRTVMKENGYWKPAPRSRLGYADSERFCGKRGGYAIHEQVQS